MIVEITSEKIEQDNILLQSKHPEPRTCASEAGIDKNYKPPTDEEMQVSGAKLLKYLKGE